MLVAELRTDLWVYAAIFAYVALSSFVLMSFGLFRSQALFAYLPNWMPTFGIFIPAGLLILEFLWAWTRQIRQPDEAARSVLSRNRVARLFAGICLMMAIGLFMGAFTSFKSSLAVMRGGFPHDIWLANFDQWLHFGLDPSNVLVSCCNNSEFLRYIDIFYSNLWMIIVFCGLFIVASMPYFSRIRFRFILLFIVTWILGGNVFAFLGLSAGPVFFENITGDGARFMPVTAMLASAGDTGLMANLFQTILWRSYSQGGTGMGVGISAFPSMHVASAMLVACFAVEFNRVSAMIGAVFMLLTLFSSVYLGWHYAVDGYFSILLVLALYLICCKFFPTGSNFAPTG